MGKFVVVLALLALAAAKTTSDIKLWWFAPVTYPPLARTARIGGVVTAEATLDKDGKIKRVEKVEGHPMLLQAVRDHIKDLRFSCGCESPAGIKYHAIYDFQIDYDCDENTGCSEASTVFRDNRWIVKVSRPQINTASSTTNRQK